MRAALAWTRVRRASPLVVAVLVTAGMTAACGSGRGHGTRQAAPPEPTAAVTTQVTIADLSRSDATSTDYLAAQQIHTASGQVIPVRLDGFIPDTHGSTQYDFRLLGSSSRGYVVERLPGPYLDDGLAEAYLVTASSTRLLDRSPARDTTYTLTSAGDRLVRLVTTEDCSQLTVLDLDDDPVASLSCKTEDSPEVLAATDTALWWAGGSYGEPDSGVSRWDYVQGGVHRLTNDVGWYAAADQALLFLGSINGPIGPTSLLHPGHLAWGRDFSPVTVSADKRYVAGVLPASEPSGSAPTTVEARRVDDGTLVSSFDFPDGAWLTDAWWEGDTAVLLAVSFPTTPFAGRLVRCRLSGGCDLVGPLVTGCYSHGPALGWDLSDR
jgi:hypothetical protein